MLCSRENRNERSTEGRMRNDDFAFDRVHARRPLIRIRCSVAVNFQLKLLPTISRTMADLKIPHIASSRCSDGRQTPSQQNPIRRFPNTRQPGESKDWKRPNSRTRNKEIHINQSNARTNESKQLCYCDLNNNNRISAFYVSDVWLDSLIERHQRAPSPAQSKYLTMSMGEKFGKGVRFSQSRCKCLSYIWVDLTLSVRCWVENIESWSWNQSDERKRNQCSWGSSWLSNANDVKRCLKLINPYDPLPRIHPAGFCSARECTRCSNPISGRNKHIECFIS